MCEVMKRYRIAAFFTVIYILFLSCGTSQINAAEYRTPVDMYKSVSALVLEGKYTEAETLARQFSVDHPKDPAGPLFIAAVIQYAGTDYEDDTRAEEFALLISKAKTLAEWMLTADPADLRMQYYLASSQALRGVWDVQNGSFMKGIMAGRNGAKGMAHIVKADSTFYDAYLMLGSYNFWKSIAVEKFDFLPFVNAKSPEGIATVEFAISKGKMTGDLSNTVFLEMLLEVDPLRAARYGEKFIRQYPSCRLFAWQLGEAYKKLNRFDDAVRVFTGIADSMESDADDDGSGQLRCWWKLAVLARDMGKMSECVNYSTKVIECGKKYSIEQKQEVRMSGASEFLEELGEAQTSK